MPVTVYFNYSHNLSDGCGDTWWAGAGAGGATVLEPLETFQNTRERERAKQNLRRAFSEFHSLILFVLSLINSVWRYESFFNPAAQISCPKNLATDNKRVKTLRNSRYGMR